MEKHFELTDESIEISGRKFFRIRATKSFGGIKKGDLGGFVEKPENLSDGAWVFGDARVYGDARVSGSARVSGNAQVYGDARVYGDAYIKNTHDYIVFQNFGSRIGTTTIYAGKESVTVACGCFTGTITEFENAVKKKHGTNKYAQEYLAIIAIAKARFDL